jgi:hypothetical protein
MHGQSVHREQMDLMAAVDLFGQVLEQMALQVRPVVLQVEMQLQMGV